jgi:uncharacterized protein (DUF1697 family)
MTRYAAFLRGVNLGKRTVKSAELKAAFETMGFTGVKTLLASGNILFDAPATSQLKATIEAALAKSFSFPIPVVLRTIEELREMVRSDPFGRKEGDDAKLHVVLADAPLPPIDDPGIPGDYEVTRITDRELFFIAYRKPDGTYLGRTQFAYEKQLPKGMLVTARNWNTILKAVA